MDSRESNRQLNARWLDIRDQIGLELIQIDVQRSVKSERCGNRGDYLSNESVQVGERGRSDPQVSATDIVDTDDQSCFADESDSRFVVNHERTIRMFQSGVSRENRVVWLDDRS